MTFPISDEMGYILSKHNIKPYVFLDMIKIIGRDKFNQLIDIIGVRTEGTCIIMLREIVKLVRDSGNEPIEIVGIEI